MSFKSIQKLNVQRTLTTGEIVSVGVLALNQQGVFLQYDENYISKFGNLSPFTLQADVRLQQAPKEPHQGILPAQVTAMDRLAFIGQQGMGALSFTPVSEFSFDQRSDIDLATLGLEAQTLFDQSLSDD